MFVFVSKLLSSAVSITDVNMKFEKLKKLRKSYHTHARTGRDVALQPVEIESRGLYIRYTWSTCMIIFYLWMRVASRRVLRKSEALAAACGRPAYLLHANDPSSRSREPARADAVLPATYGCCLLNYYHC